MTSRVLAKIPPKLEAKHFPRPHFHFTAPRGWLNDPHGLIVEQLEDGPLYHLFFQHNPEEVFWRGRALVWGHATSRDLLQWENHGSVIKGRPGEGVYSGSCVQVPEKMRKGKLGADAQYAIYYTSAEPEVEGTPQVQHLAVSTDLRTWEPKGLVLDRNLQDFRDPQVFFHEGVAYQVVSESRPNRIHIYQSEDLCSWDLCSLFPESLEAFDYDDDWEWECAYLYELPIEGTQHTAWILKIDITYNGPHQNSGTRVFFGDFKKGVFSPFAIAPQWLEYGCDFYAAQAWVNHEDSRGRKLWLGWLCNPRYEWFPTQADCWTSMMSVPRWISLRRDRNQDSGLYLSQEPALDPVDFTSRHFQLAAATVLELNALITQQRVAGQAMVLKLTLSRGQASTFWLDVLGSFSEEDEEQHEFTRITVDFEKGTLVIDRSRSGTVAHLGVNEAVLQSQPRGPIESIELQVFIDRYSIELFSPRITMSALVFPTLSEGQVRLDADHPESLRCGLEVWC